MESRQITDKNITLEDMLVFKKEARQKIEQQKVQIISTAQQLIPFSSSSTTSFAPLTFLTSAFRKGRVMTVIQGAIIGYNFVRKIRKLIKK
ncbi:MAG TPA: hypothetical protein PKH58_07025 [Paludibacteraceae bacterium]|nr:hypothetical protein [Paludibacteraceae bacterium]HPT43085.1 hypothetical protein [Paludibacteraceae bacterium]